MVGRDDFDPAPLASFTFIAPIGEGLMDPMTFTGANSNFGIATAGGVVVGSLVMAIATKTFRVESFADANDMIRHIVDAAMMDAGRGTHAGLHDRPG
ncbi:MAG TPA: YeeE/YedE thiosulfate transporter family protein [Alphaproteobacteria bacterium]